MTGTHFDYCSTLTVLSEFCANQATPSSTISNSNTALLLWLGAARLNTKVTDWPGATLEGRLMRSRAEPAGESLHPNEIDHAELFAPPVTGREPT